MNETYLALLLPEMITPPGWRTDLLNDQVLEFLILSCTFQACKKLHMTKHKCETRDLHHYFITRRPRSDFATQRMNEQGLATKNPFYGELLVQVYSVSDQNPGLIVRGGVERLFSLY
jgi:hypothetical protein